MCRHCPDNLREALANRIPTPLDIGDMGEVRRRIPDGDALSESEVVELHGLAVRLANRIFEQWHAERSWLAKSPEGFDNFCEGALPPSPP